MSRVGEEGYTRNGNLIKIVAYRSTWDLDVELVDYAIVIEHKNYRDFKNGRINEERVLRLHEKGKNNLGEDMEIIKYHSANNIDVKFSDGTIVLHKKYSAFKDGAIKNPTANLERIKGLRVKASNGQVMKIKEFRGYDDVDIEFEDGTIVCNKGFGNFKRGLIKNPNVPDVRVMDERVGEEYELEDGRTCKIVKYNRAENVDIEFPDRKIEEGVNYKALKQGKLIRTKQPERGTVGETSVNIEGETMTITKVRGYKYVDIKFNDGVEVDRVEYRAFLEGDILKP